MRTVEYGVARDPTESSDAVLPRVLEAVKAFGLGIRGTAGTFRQPSANTAARRTILAKLRCAARPLIWKLTPFLCRVSPLPRSDDASRTPSR